MKELKGIFTNFKTSIPALLGLVCVGLYFTNYIDEKQLSIGVATLVSLGLLGAKDHSK